jgi:hypothetical protein
MVSKPVSESIKRKINTIPITCSLDSQAHNVTDDGLAAGQCTGHHQALCRHRVSAAALATPPVDPAGSAPQSRRHSNQYPLCTRVATPGTVSPDGCGGNCAPAQYRRRHGRLITTMPGASLTGTDLHHWIALRRVFDGEVTRLDGCGRDHGHLLPRYVMDALMGC